MPQTSKNPAGDRAFTGNTDSKFDTSIYSEIHRFIQPQESTISDHKRAEKMLGYALTLGEIDTWLGAVQVWKARLTASELAALAYSALKAQSHEHAELTIKAVFGQNGTPLPPLVSAMDEAAFWADYTNPKYIKACVLAGYNRMSPADQAAFLSHVQGRMAA